MRPLIRIAAFTAIFLLPLALFAADTVPRPKPVDPPAPEEIDAAIRRGVDFLLAVQEKNGSFGSARNTKGRDVLATVPGAHHAFRGAVTSLCISALIESGDERSEVSGAIDRAEAWMFEHLPQVRRAAGVDIYNVWTHSYAVSALVDMHGRHQGNQERQAKIRELMQHQIDMLDRYEALDGGWGYYNFGYATKVPSGEPTSFTTATALIALHEAAESGIEVKIPEKMIQRAKAVVLRCRKPDSSYEYLIRGFGQPMRSINRPGGSLGRSQVCNLALRLYDDEKITEQVLIDWLDRLFARQLWLDIGRKRPIPHESWFLVAGYFYYYGHFYAAGCIEQLPEERRPVYQAHLSSTLLPLQEKNGSWWDFPLYDYHQQHGTALAIMSLQRCRAN